MKKSAVNARTSSSARSEEILRIGLAVGRGCGFVGIATHPPQVSSLASEAVRPRPPLQGSGLTAHRTTTLCWPGLLVPTHTLSM